VIKGRLPAQLAELDAVLPAITASVYPLYFISLFQARRRISVSKALFSFQGRTTRLDYWTIAIGLFLAITFPQIVLTYAVATPWAVCVALVLSLLSLWPSLAIVARRLHDRNLSALWIIAGFIPIANLWLYIEVGFLRGTVGPNRFGDDPLQKVASNGSR
jgi:uncharacterized membrane protein YhaH (DUF805 family)